MIQIDVQATYAVVRRQKPLTVGLVGAKVRFSFGEDWDGLVKTAVFRQGEVTVDAVNVSSEAEIPCEVLTQPGLPVQIGLYGTNADGTVVIPTLWAETEPVQPGADPSGDTSTAAALPVYQQISAQMGALDSLETQAKDTLVAAINEANRAVCLVTAVQNEDGTYSADKSIEELSAAEDAGKVLLCYLRDVRVLTGLTGGNSGSTYVFTAVIGNTEHRVVMNENGVFCDRSTLATEQSRLPNPEKLTFEGAVSATYDGSSPVVVNIPKGGSGVHVGSEPPADPSVNVWIDPEGGDGDLDLTIPDALPNPHKLTFTGAVTGEYDGSQAVTVALPEVMTVELTESNGTYTANKTQQEILAAYEAGQEVRCIEGSMVLPLVQCHVGFCAFACVYNTKLYSVLIKATDNSVTMTVTDASAGGSMDLSGYIPAPETAAVGQTVAVRAVDETGKPTQWEAVDLAKGGEGSSIEMHHINTLTLEEDVQWVYCDKDGEGNPFEVKELAINVYSVGAEGNTSEGYFKVVPNHNTYVSGRQLTDIPSGIRMNGSTRSMAIKVHGDGVLAYSVCSSQDNVNAFDDNMLLTGRLGSGGASFCSSVYGLSTITSLMFGSDTSSVLLGKGTKIAVWGR